MADKKQNEKIVTRFAPSPTGLLHLGNYRTALFSYIFAKQHIGHFLLRIEDTDKERSKSEYENNIIESLDWLKLDYGPTFFRQSERASLHQKYLQKLIDEGKAYVSKEAPKETAIDESKQRRSEVIRFRNPNKKVTFTDLIRGDVSFDTTELKDFVIAKSLTEPLFHLAVVVDDFEMGITHIVRGEDHISNTPRQILIQEAIGAPRPIYAHLPLILASDRSKLSKRKGAQALTSYRDQGYLPQALINYLALLGWNPGTEQEIFSLEQLLKTFDLSKVQKGGAIFDEKKLRWINKQHMLALPKDELYARVKEAVGDLKISGDMLAKVTAMLLERAETFGDITEMVKTGELDYLLQEPKYESKELLWKGKGELATAKKRLEHTVGLIENIKKISGQFTKEMVKDTIWDYATREGRGEVLWPMRFALSGKEKSPDPFVLAELLGQTETIKRLKTAIEKCG